jgi:nickel-dependent lactate racemase
MRDPLPIYRLPYGKTYLEVTLPNRWQVELMAPTMAPAVPDSARATEAALAKPVGSVTLADFAGARSAAIAINDKTRPVPHDVLLPPLLQRLEGLRLSPEAITLLIATGAHPPMARREWPDILPPDILSRYPVVCHNAYDRGNLIYLGETRRGTPVWVNRRFAEADLRIVVGNIEPHQFQGFSGGVKSAAIGLAGVETINYNHAMMVDDQCRPGCYDENPARQDVEEIGRLIGVHFALNAILNQDREIVQIMAGEPGAVMREGIPLVRKLYQVPVSAPFDLVIASPGGHPKDINLYQAQKGLAHAAMATRDGGTVILVAACPEGTGSESYERWMEGMTSYGAVFERFQREGFQVGPHKAFQIARDAARVRVLLVSQMPSQLVRRLLLTPVADLGETLSLVLEELSPKARIGVMPWANATIPVLKQPL